MLLETEGASEGWARHLVPLGRGRKSLVHRDKEISQSACYGEIHLMREPSHQCLLVGKGSLRNAEKKSLWAEYLL